MDRIEELKKQIAAIEAGEGDGDLEALKAELADLEAKAKEGGNTPPTTPSDTPPPADGTTTPPPSAPPTTPPPSTPPPADPVAPPVVEPPPSVVEDTETTALRNLALELLQTQLNDLPEAARTMITEKAAGDPMKMRDLIVLARSMGNNSTAQPPAVNTAQAGNTQQDGPLTLEGIRNRAAMGAYS